jgi:hypothetical protein
MASQSARTTPSTKKRGPKPDVPTYVRFEADRLHGSVELTTEDGDETWSSQAGPNALTQRF